MELLLVLGGLAVIIAVSIGAANVLYWIIDKCHKKVEAKREAEHPELYRLFRAVNEKSTECCHWYNKEIAPRKRKIDAILKEWDYYTAGMKRIEEQELEELREAIELAKVTNDLLENELRDLRQQVRDYITAHEIKWANGWMD